MSETPEWTMHEMMFRLEKLTPETHKAMSAIYDLVDKHHWSKPVLVSALAWVLADAIMNSAKPPACFTKAVGLALQKIVEKETGTTCPSGHQHPKEWS
jgi:hypothetical protein